MGRSDAANPALQRTVIVSFVSISFNLCYTLYCFDWFVDLAVGIRYGKFCGVGWTGCPGEKPCDDLDACCKIHDECVSDKGNKFVYFNIRKFRFSLYYYRVILNA